jgi:glyoxylase-like metal-dependent hydrolase (beta-lactamase superfamily II)
MTVNLTPPPFHIGEMRVQRIMEMQLEFRLPGEMFPSAMPEDLAALAPQFTPWAIHPVSGMAILAIQSYLVRTARHTILIDTCIGCDKTNTRIPSWAGRTDRRWLKRLAQSGVAPEQVDYVFCTHMHADHSGWNTQLVDGRWVPTFPNAKYIFARAEVEHAERAGLPQYAENVLPVIAAGQAILVDSDHALDDGLWLEPTPGHTPGHVSVRISSRGEEALITGDCIHHPVQMTRTDWCSSADYDRAQGQRTREDLLARYAESDVLVIGTHFATPTAGRVRRRAGGGYWLDVN